MAIFETDGSTEIHITPKEFYGACKYSEQVQMYNIIMDDFDLVNDDEEKSTGHPSPRHPSPRSYSEEEFYVNLATLEENWLSLTKKDAEKIKKIAKKYE